VTPLEELSLLLGVEVTRVQRDEPPRTSRAGGRTVYEQDVITGQNKRQGWWVKVAGTPGYFQLPSSDEFRRPATLIRWAGWWGRNPSLPLLTSKDGRRALRLMHELTEHEGATK
jgi:hypothetical protein